jgi:uncharacterized protein (TIGR00369 family)
MSRLDLGNDRMCFCCGAENAEGLKLEFDFEGGRARTSLAFPKKYQGYRDIVHGGLIATVLDETMVTLVNHMGHRAVTAELNVRFLAPLKVGEGVEISAWMVEEHGRLLQVAASAVRSDGTEIARARSTCLSMGHLGG